MSDLVWCGLILAFFVWGFVYLMWRTGWELRRNTRDFWVQRDRELRRDEDEAWAAFLAEGRLRRQGIDDAMDANGAVDRLVALIQRTEKLDVVA